MIIDFSDQNLPIGVSGVSFTESFGRWTDGPQVRMTVPIRALPLDAQILKFDITLSAFVPPAVGVQIVDVLANGSRIASWTFQKHAEWSTKHFYLERKRYENEFELKLELLIHYPTRPADLGANDDPRMLGVAVKSLMINGVESFDNVNGRAASQSDFSILPGGDESDAEKARRDDQKWFFPNQLTVGGRSGGKFAILGTCVAEAMVNDVRMFTGNAADHYLVGSSLNDVMPDISGRGYNAAVVHLTLRHVWHYIIPRPYDDLMHARMSEDEQRSLIDSAREFLHKLVAKFMAELPAGMPVFFMSFIEPPATLRGLFWNNRRTSLYYLVRSMNDVLAEILDNISSGFYLEVNDIRQYYGDMSSYDGYESYFVHGANFSGEFSAALGSRIEQALRVLNPNQPIKLIVTDLDNTLWKGVLAEEEEIIPSELVDGWPLGYAEALLECKRRGILLAISSKNDEKFIRENFAKVYGERLVLDDFCSIKVSWNPKSEGIREILSEVNLLPQNVLFIDDNPLEIAEVKQALPDIRVLTGEQRLWKMILHYSPETQVSVVTEESAKRTELIRAKIDREHESKGTDRLTYLNSLGINVKVSIVNSRADARFARSFELINKTNQFNTTGKRWSEQECEELFADGGELVSINASDKHAQHGLIAVAIVRHNHIEQVVMSCRVFGLGIETALLNILMKRMLTMYSESFGRFQSTGRNSTCENYFPNAGFELVDGVYRGNKTPEFPAWIAVEEMAGS
ncbi:HAD-IIIC family phosphatase [Burkholderia cepacia]|uniref:HAD-IIIC family phosphatase n=1 Tax=Burkholderia cepacia TaxID=292 RepID=UPI00249DC16F|nr:HAD-IIIC family phosphatase [Burkholderia cepacia]WGY69085.1 HAD-IIIC family phosphatase [Burkholderia cepacia]